jgi:toxin-antitoxin system PIN domain toxin
MYLIDANILIYAMSERDPHHEKAVAWFADALEGPSQTVGLPWPCLVACLRVATNPRLYPTPRAASDVVAVIEDWLDRPAAWIPAPGPRHIAHLGRQLRESRASGNVVSDAHLAALATEHALTVVTADRDFGRFESVKSLNPLAN